MSQTERPYRIQAEIGRLLHIVNYRWHRCVVTGQEKAGMDQETIVNGRILGYLSMEKNDVYQKDLEKVVGLTKSAISTILSRMAEKGYIERQSVEGDARLKRIVLTPFGEETQQIMRQSLEKADENFVKGLSEEEQKELLRMLTIVNNNMKEMEAETKS
ncbi:MAG: winged helix-turn-helix transcriptional regulator [Lachnospiraceae bacterium]|nr:winged helix-turn-helix transcriptional regulator [Lachnospiraceae bacterium]